MEDIADARAAVVLCRQAAYFEDQFRVAVIEDANLSVGRLAVIEIAKAPADAHGRRGNSLEPRPQRATSI